jgi:hypothetical protein
MAGQSERFKAFVKLGTFLREFIDGQKKFPLQGNSDDPWNNSLNEAIELAGRQNAWFTRENIMQALASWGEQLRKENLEEWLSRYDLGKNKTKTVAIIMAGNIPLVGFHDFLTVLITGNKAQVKRSSNDRILLPFVSEYLSFCDRGIGEAIVFQESSLKSYDAVIATGTNNTSRYFEYYFGRKPHIIRKNRNAAAVISGSESHAELTALGVDVFRYFGLGCRNVSKLFVPVNYDFTLFFTAMEQYSEVGLHRKYANNYDYNKAVYLMSGFPFLDNGFLMLKEDPGYSSPIGVLYYEYYKNAELLNERFDGDNDQIQCLLGGGNHTHLLPFGKAQEPALWDYADGVDTVEFLLGT